MRGEKIIKNDIFYRGLGSSPHARGKALTRKSVCQAHRIIPACAGKRPQERNHGVNGQDHPRMRGEKVG